MSQSVTAASQEAAEECVYCSGTGDMSETIEGTADDIGEDCPHCNGDGTLLSGEDWA